MVDTGYDWSYPRASIWQGMNFIMVNPNLAVVNELQTGLIRALEKYNIDGEILEIYNIVGENLEKYNIVGENLEKYKIVRENLEKYNIVGENLENIT